MKKISFVLKKEIKMMCSKRVGSILCSDSLHTLTTFKWADLLNELNIHAPTLTTFLHACTETKTFRRNRESTIGVCAAVLLKHREQKMDLFQKIISIIMKAGHCGKQVYVILDQQCTLISSMFV